MTQIRLEADNYTLRVLDVIKGKYGLKNRSEALKKFAKEYGEDFVEPELSDSYVQMLREQVEEYEKNPSKFKKSSIDDVDTLWED
ncbi:MAG: DUF2683 family protein [Nanoarchaeota archaeon]|nr:DUF2683 family protein [Nanoarchaeota archaeon]